jgi:RNA polymerase sigma-70 factor (ECF subfamily)
MKITETFIQNRSKIYNQIIKLTKNKGIADDLIQDLFIQMSSVQEKGKYNEELNLLPLIITSAQNLTYDYFRKNKRMHMVRSTDEYDVFDFLSPVESNAESTIIKKQETKEIQELLKHLSIDEKEIVVKRFYEELSYEEIAKKTNKPLGTIKATLFRIKEKLHVIKKENDKRAIKKPFINFNNSQYQYSLKMSDNTENNISGLRNHLFDAIRKLEGGIMKADEAKAMASLAQTIINSAKLELDYKQMIEKQPNIKMLND